MINPPKADQVEFDELAIYNFKDTIYLLCSGYFLVIVAYIIEIIHYLFYNNFIF